MSQGLEFLDGILENSRNITQSLEGLEGASFSAEIETLQGSMDQLEGLKDKFFMKTVAAIPAARKCLTSSEKVLETLNSFKDDQNDPAAVKQALKDLSETANELMEGSQMRGTILT